MATIALPVKPGAARPAVGGEYDGPFGTALVVAVREPPVDDRAGHRDSGAYLPKFAWTKIVRHYMVPGTASPDDPALAQYWADRRRRNKPPLDRSTLHLTSRIHGLCSW